MTQYAKLYPDTQLFDCLIELSEAEFANLQANGKAERLLRMWVPTAPPAPNASQVLEPAAPIITATTATQAWALRAKIQAELDTDTAAVEKTTLKAALALFDARTATNAQVQRAIAWLIRQQG